MRVPTAAEMTALDREAQDSFHLPGLLLMEHAALALAGFLERTYGPLAGRRVEIACGAGNNAGDGYALARLLLGRGARPRVLQVGDPEKLRGDARANWEALAPLGIPVEEGAQGAEPEALLVDALLGTGATGAPRGAFEGAVEALAGRPGPVVAVDVPTGVPADGGPPPGGFLPADHTVTMGLPKPFAVCPVARPHAGEVAVASIGFPPALLTHERYRTRLVLGGVAAGWLAPRPADAHKGTSGRVLVVAGAPGTSGAATLAVRGALRAGAGLVRLLGPPGSARDLGSSLPEAMVVERDPAPEGGGPGARALEELTWADAVVLGPGLGPETSAWAEVVERFEGPLVLDADGLALAEAASRAEGYRVLTPHPGEAGRLLEASVGPDLPSRRRAIDELWERRRVDVLLKGRFSLLRSEAGTWVNGSGSPALATGGTGDVLAGILGALLAERGGRSTSESVALGAYLHGVAGFRVPVGARASEVADQVPGVRAALQELARGARGAPYPALLEGDAVSLVGGSSIT